MTPAQKVLDAYGHWLRAKSPVSQAHALVALDHAMDELYRRESGAPANAAIYRADLDSDVFDGDR